MTQILLNPESQLNANGQYNEIFEFFKGTDLNADTSYPILEATANDFINRTDQSVHRAILDSVYHPASDLFIYPEQTDPFERYSWSFGFQNFYRAVHNVLTGHKPLSLQSNGAHPQYVLKSDAFEYMGHNDLNIKPSKASYASLFYH